MRIKRTGRTTKLTAVAAGAAIGVGVAASPAAAHQWTNANAWGTASPHVEGQSGTDVHAGDVVAFWQSQMVTDGRDVWTHIDGNFGAATKLITQAYQTAHGLTADGRVGPATWNTAKTQFVPRSCGWYTATLSYCWIEKDHAPNPFTVAISYSGDLNTWKWLGGCTESGETIDAFDPTSYISTNHPSNTWVTNPYC